jgi:hypothetical protein
MQRSKPQVSILLTDHTAPLCVIILLAIWGVTIAGRTRFTCTHLSEEYGGSHRVQSTAAPAPWQPGQQATVPVGSVIPNSSRACEGTPALFFTLVSEKNHDLRTIS